MPTNTRDSIACSSNTNTRKRKRSVDVHEQSLADALFASNEPPTKKQRLSEQQWKQSISDRYNRDKHMNITWENHAVLSKTCVNKLYNRITQLLSIGNCGFKHLDEDTLNTFINNQMKNKYHTINGIQLTDLEQQIVPRLVRGLRTNYIQVKTMYSTQKIPQIFASRAFRQFEYDVVANGKTLTDKDQQHWIQICNSNAVAPYTLIQHWFKRNKILKKNKDVNEWIKSIQTNEKSTQKYDGKMRKVVQNKSFGVFCLSISLMDFCSFHYEARRQDRSQEFEELIYNKLDVIVSGLNTKYDKEITMLTEEEQRTNNSKLTPDILFSEGIWINNHKVHWIDVKNYFVMDVNKGFMWKKVKKQCVKYTDAFGTGAVVCRFQNELKTP
eukprot:102534_1